MDERQRLHDIIDCARTSDELKTFTYECALIFWAIGDEDGTDTVDGKECVSKLQRKILSKDSTSDYDLHTFTLVQLFKQELEKGILSQEDWTEIMRVIGPPKKVSDASADLLYSSAANSSFRN